MVCNLVRPPVEANCYVYANDRSFRRDQDADSFNSSTFTAERQAYFGNLPLRIACPPARLLWDLRHAPGQSFPVEYFARLQFQCADLVTVADCGTTAVQRPNGRMREFSVPPRDVHLKAAARVQTFHAAGWPVFGQPPRAVSFFRPRGSRLQGSIVFSWYI